MTLVDSHSPLAWLLSGDTGISSTTIWSVMMGEKPSGGGGFGPSVPWDPSDFGRCYRLLKRFPAWRKRLGEVADALPDWAPLVREWDELERLYEQELPTGSAPTLYARMKVLIDEGRARGNATKEKR